VVVTARSLIAKLGKVISFLAPIHSDRAWPPSRKVNLSLELWGMEMAEGIWRPEAGSSEMEEVADAFGGGAVLAEHSRAAHCGRDAGKSNNEETFRRISGY
jgi:hypothetical protein